MEGKETSECLIQEAVQRKHAAALWAWSGGGNSIVSFKPKNIPREFELFCMRTKREIPFGVIVCANSVNTPVINEMIGHDRYFDTQTRVDIVSLNSQYQTKNFEHLIPGSIKVIGRLFISESGKTLDVFDNFSETNSEREQFYSELISECSVSSLVPKWIIKAYNGYHSP